MSFVDEAACSGFELYVEDGGRCVISKGQRKQETEEVNHDVQYLLLPSNCALITYSLVCDFGESFEFFGYVIN